MRVIVHLELLEQPSMRAVARRWLAAVAEIATVSVLVPRHDSPSFVVELDGDEDASPARIDVVTEIPRGSVLVLGVDCLVNGHPPDPSRLVGIVGTDDDAVGMRVMGMADRGAVLVLTRAARRVAMGREAVLELASRLCAAVQTSPGRN